MTDIIASVIKNVLTALYQPLWGAVLISVLFMFCYLYAYDPNKGGKGFKSAIKTWINEFKTSVVFRKLFLLAFVTTMILFQTLLYRKIWQNPVSNIMGGWWIWKVNKTTGQTELTTECFENLTLMIPFVILVLWNLKDSIKKAFTFLSIIWLSFQISLTFSLLIELLQLIFHLGTFQLSDIAYNSLGGIIGGAIYWICHKVRNRKY